MTFAQRLRRVPLLLWIVVPVAVLALVAWPLGGWDTVTLVSRTLPEFKSNQVFHTHRFDIRLDSAWLTTTHHPAGYGPPTKASDDDPDEVYLVVRAEFTNITTEATGSSELGGYIIPVIDGVDFDRYSGVDYVLVSDHTTLPELNPGIPRDMFLVWTIPAADVKAGDRVHFDLYDATPQKSVLFYGIRWDFAKAGTAERTLTSR